MSYVGFIEFDVEKGIWEMMILLLWSLFGVIGLYLIFDCGFMLFDRYLSDLLSERNKLSPFVPVLQQCYRLLNQGEFSELVFVKSL